MTRTTMAKIATAGSAPLDGPLNERIYQTVKWGLIVGDYAPNDAISIRRIAAELGTSTMPVREALKRLVSERALTSSANRSFRVADHERKKISELFFLRSSLEGIATELAATRLTAPQIDRLDELAAQMDADVVQRDAKNYLSRNYTFHFTIYTAAGNGELVSIIESLWAQTGPFLAMGVRNVGMTPDWRRKHGEIADAIRARDAASARAHIEEDISWGTEVFKDIRDSGKTPD